MNVRPGKKSDFDSKQSHVTTETNQTLVETFLVKHTSFAQGINMLKAAFEYSERKGEAEGIAIVGESGTGKTTIVRHFMSLHPTVRTTDGLEVPILMASTPSLPTTRGLAGELLAAMGAEDADQGTELQRTYRLKRLIVEAKTRLIVLDEFQHIYDRGKHKVMHAVADWIKLLMDDTRATVVVCGLPTAMTVINSNEQLARRFMAPLELKRFRWTNADDRDQFQAILGAFSERISQVFDIPELDSDEMSFRLYIASGGLLGYVSKLIRQTLRNVGSAGHKMITLADFDRAHSEAIWMKQRAIVDLPRPFANPSLIAENAELFQRVEKIGTLPDPIASSKRNSLKTKPPTVSALLSHR